MEIETAKSTILAETRRYSSTLPMFLNDIRCHLHERGLASGNHYEITACFESSEKTDAKSLVSRWSEHDQLTWGRVINSTCFELGFTLPYLDRFDVILAGRSMARALARKRTMLTKVSIYSPAFNDAQTH